MSNFKLKHQSKSGLFRHADWHKEIIEPKPISPGYPAYIPSEMEKKVEYIHRYEKVYQPPKVREFKPIIKEDPNKFNYMEDTRVLEESANMRNREKNRIKYQNQELKKAAQEAAREAFEE